MASPRARTRLPDERSLTPADVVKPQRVAWARCWPPWDRHRDPSGQSLLVGFSAEA